MARPLVVAYTSGRVIVYVDPTPSRDISLTPHLSPLKLPLAKVKQKKS